MRCNVGVNPRYLFDQHLLPEGRELNRILGSLKYWNYEIKSPVPNNFKLGAGHMNFLKMRLKYLQRRQKEVVKELERRNIKHDLFCMDLTNISQEFCNDWQPPLIDTQTIRNRIIERILNYPNPFMVEIRSC